MGAIFLQAMASRVPGKLAILKGYQGFEIVLGSAAANTVRLLPRGIRRARCVAFIETCRFEA